MSLSSTNLGPAGGFGTGPDQGLYPISVVTELTGISANTLRGYDRAGLISPSRTEGGSRRYSDNDLARLRRITALTDDGVPVLKRLTGAGPRPPALRAPAVRPATGPGPTARPGAAVRR
ncbi:MerR family transcriptional regulator [Planosporangium mesophilum]|uniref:HTH merR-type domain-containing protein n=1 Tax=Planosporangium mesophilum TaxID=689768 RepID=A0A8J3X2X5_9ACTN|nr:MerR family transcriptional regulator [Planosporangium mesophilum]NJC85989.1 MerR family transcriptional regulator [Planosporangium mesophilum]GII25910.1 hypothetical protein Pme01_55070 [Planosporangium mesophilum]